MGVCLCLFVKIRSTAMHFSTIMLNINQHSRKFDSNFASVEGEAPPVLHMETATTAGKSSRVG